MPSTELEVAAGFPFAHQRPWAIQVGEGEEQGESELLTGGNWDGAEGNGPVMVPCLLLSPPSSLLVSLPGHPPAVGG